MGIVPQVGLVLHVGRDHRDRLILVASDAVLGDLLVGLVFGKSLLRLHSQYNCRKRSLSVIDVTNCSYVDVCFLNHRSLSPFKTGLTSHPLASHEGEQPA